MNSDIAIELIGYLASALIVLSITQKSILRLRVLGLVGALTFLVYSIVIGAYPIAVVNVIAAAVHAWYLRNLIGRKDEVFRILHVDQDSKYLLDFLDFYGDDIQARFQPGFTYQPGDEQTVAFILRDMVPAGLLIGHARDDRTFEVDLDFVIPQYRDFKIGRYVYSTDSALWTGSEPTCVWTDTSNADYARYLSRMGFAQCPGIEGRYEIQLTPHVDAAAQT